MSSTEASKGDQYLAIEEGPDSECGTGERRGRCRSEAVIHAAVTEILWCIAGRIALLSVQLSPETENSLNTITFFQLPI